MKSMLLTVCVVLAVLSGVVSAQDSTERKKIEFLISSIEHLQGAQFIRNGTEHPGKEAAEHLRMKLKNTSAVKTADDFIRLCASQSMITGKPYLIKLPDGKTIKSERYLREKLKAYNATAK